MLAPVDNFQCVGHRGFCALYPENTLIGFEKSAEAGATMVELDVQLSGDDVVVIFHDNTTVRLTGEEHHIEDLTWKELRNFTLLDKNAEIVQKGQICALDELFQTLQKKVRYYVEIKTGEEQPRDYKQRLVAKVLALVKEHGLMDSVMFASFERCNLEELQRQGNTAPIALNIRYQLPADAVLDGLAKDKVAALCPDQNLLNEKIIRSYKERGFKVIPWGVNESERMEQLIHWGVDGITTNYPNRLCEVVKKLQQAGK